MPSTLSIKKEIIDYPIADIIVMPGNAKHHPQVQIDQMSRNVDRFGWTIPVFLTERGELIAGAGRLQLAQFRGMTTIPAVIGKGLSVEDARALRLSDNKLAELGQVNESAVAMELADLVQDLDFDLDGLGFLPDELTDLLTDFMPDDDQEEDEPERKTGTSGSVVRGPDRVVEDEPEKGLPKDLMPDDKKPVGPPQIEKTLLIKIFKSGLFTTVFNSKKNAIIFEIHRSAVGGWPEIKKYINIPEEV